MLKHVTYRSTSSLGRQSDFFFRNESIVSAETDNSKEDQSISKLSNSVSNPLPSTDCANTPPPPSSFCRSIKDDDLVVGTKDHLSLSPFRPPDSVSLTSALSFASLHQVKYSSLGDRTYSSLDRGKYSSSRCSSAISLNDQYSTIPVKVFLRRLRSDMEYKTVCLSSQTTCRSLIMSLLSKFRLRHRDPNLFFVLMEVTVRSPSDNAPVKRLLVLDDNARPAELQQCRPKGEAIFSIGVRRGGLVRVHDSILNPGSQYKSLLVSHYTTVEELVELILNCCSNKENPKHYCLHEICRNPYKDRRLRPEDSPIQIQSAWPKDEKSSWAFVLRRNVGYTLSLMSKLSWRRSMDQSSTDTEPEMEDHNTTRASIMSTSSTVSNSSSISSSSCASSSSGVSSDASSCSSSGVSSGDSVICSSPAHSPPKPSCTSTPVTKIEIFSKFTAVRPPKPVPRTLFPALPPKDSCQELPTFSSSSSIPEKAQNAIAVTTLPRKTCQTTTDLLDKKNDSGICLEVSVISSNKEAANSTGSLTCNVAGNDSKNLNVSVRDTEELGVAVLESQNLKPLEKYYQNLSLSKLDSQKCSESQKIAVLTTTSEVTEVVRSSTVSYCSRRYSPKIASIRSLSKSSYNITVLSPLTNKSRSYQNLNFSICETNPTDSVTPKATNHPSSYSVRRHSTDITSPLKAKSLSISSRCNLKNESHCSLKCENCFYI